MHKRHNAQRQHIIYSLDSLLFQLCAVSFFLSPSLLAFVSRLFCQFQCSKPRDIDPSRSLRFWYFMLVFFNIGSIWAHTTQGAAEGRAIVLDFVGQGHVPSKMHLLLLDAFILFLQIVLTTISYEVSLVSKKESDPTALASSPSPLQLPSQSPLPNANTDEGEPPKSSLFTESLYIVDLRLVHILDRLRSPAPIIPSSNTEGLLPLPNTTPWPLPASLRLLIRARAEVRRRAQAQAQRQTRMPGSGNEETVTDTSRRIPGEMDIEDG